MLSLAGCSLFSYDLTTPPAIAPTGPVYVGTDCAPIILGLGAGHLSVAEAMKDGGITTPTKITLDQNLVLIVGWNCLTVEGEGPGPAPKPVTAPMHNRK